MRKPLIAGNWKMNGRLASASALATQLCAGAAARPQVELAVFPPYLHLPAVASALGANHPATVAWGAQNLSERADGAFTGEVSAAMLADLGCHYVLVGHSERRALYGETSALVAAKLLAAREAGLRPILCVGETLLQREQNQTEAVIAEQLNAILNSDAAGAAALADAVIAYEPVWAIGTGQTASPEQAQAVHTFIRGVIAEHNDTIAASLRIVYGGSVKASNAVALFAMPDIDGGLVGGASLNADEFLAIADAAY